MNNSRLALVGSSALLAFLVACSAAPAPLAEGNATKKKDTTQEEEEEQGSDEQDQTATPKAPSTTPSTTPTGADGATCGAKPTADACYECCLPDTSAMEAAAKVYDDCICKTTCASQCGSDYCKNPDAEPSQACQACMETATQCEQQADAACDGNAACKAASTCMDTAKCHDKQ